LRTENKVGGQLKTRDGTEIGRRRSREETPERLRIESWRQISFHRKIPLYKKKKKEQGNTKIWNWGTLK